MAVAPRRTPAPEPPEPPPATDHARAEPREPGHTAALGILAALCALCGLAAALGGARAVPDATWVEVLAALVALVTLTAWAADRRPDTELAARARAFRDPLWPAGFGARASAVAWAGLAAIVLLALWALASIAWGSRPDAAWDVANREIAYALVLACAIAAGTSAPRALPRAAGGIVAVTTLVALWALGGIVAPGLFDDAARDGRLHDPLATFLDLAILCGLAAPVALRLFASGTPRTELRLAALAAAVVLITTLGLTYSRAGVLVALAGLATSVVAGGARLRTLAAALLAVGASALPLAVAFARQDTLGTSAADGRAVGLALLGAVALAVGAAWFSLRSEASSVASFTPRRAGAAGLALAGLAVVALGLGAVAVASSEGGLDRRLDELTAATPAPRDGGPDRLRDADNGGRRILWDEALGAASDKPAAGWGAGSWPVVHGLYRPSDLPGRDAQSSVLQVLAERGAVGLTLLALAVLALLAAVALRIHRLPSGPARDVTAATLGAGAGMTMAMLVASAWEVPALALPALVLLGVGASAPDRLTAHATAFADPDPREGGWRWAVLAAGAIVLALVATSALLPAWSRGRTEAAYEQASDLRATEDDLEAAAADARLASKLDPPSIGPQLAAAAVAVRRGRLLEARGELLQAIEEQPDSALAWAALARLALRLADRPGGLAAARRALALDPHDPQLLALARAAEASQAPPSASPTATGTPLPPFVVK